MLLSPLANATHHNNLCAGDASNADMFVSTSCLSALLGSFMRQLAAVLVRSCFSAVPAALLIGAWQQAASHLPAAVTWLCRSGVSRAEMVLSAVKMLKASSSA